MTFITHGHVWQFQLPGLSYDSSYTNTQHGVKYMQEKRKYGLRRDLWHKEGNRINDINYSAYLFLLL